MSANFTTIMYGTLQDLDSILDREEMSEQELRASIQRVLHEVQTIRHKLEILAATKASLKP